MSLFRRKPPTTELTLGEGNRVILQVIDTHFCLILPMPSSEEAVLTLRQVEEFLRDGKPITITPFEKATG